MPFPALQKIAVLPYNGLFEVERDKTGKMRVTGGLEAEFLEVLSHSLKFRVEVVAPEDGEWGREISNGSWTGLVGMVLRQEADIAIGGIAVTEKRAQVIHYSVPYRFTYLTFATNLPPQLPRFTTFLYPFTLKLWIALAVLVLTMPFVFRIFLSQKRTLADHFFDTIKCLLYEPMAMRLISAVRDYFLIGAWLIGSMFISFGYAATLLSFLTIPLSEPGVQNIKQLSELVEKGNFRSGAFKGTNVLNILEASHHPSIVALARHIRTNKYDIEPEKDVVKRFYASKNSALIAPEIYFRMTFPKTLQMSPEPLKCTAIAMVVSKSFCCKRELDSHISRMFDSGVSHQIVKRVLTRVEIQTSMNETNSDQNPELNVEDLMGAFVFHVIGTFLSVVVFIVEMIIGKLKRRELMMMK